MSNLLKKYFLPLVIIGIVIQIFLSLVTYHPDLRAFVLASKFINQGEITTFYDHVSKLPQSDDIKKIYGDDIFIYPPLAYLIPSAIYAPFSSFLSKSYQEIIYTDSAIYQKYSFYPSFLIFKLPAILFSLLVLFLLPKLFEKKEHGQLAQILWLFSPTNLLVSSMGQVDAILVFFIVLSFFYIKKDRLVLAGIALALSALVKPTGLILLPLLALFVYRKDGLWKSIMSVLPGIITWSIISLPFIFSPAYRMYALFAAHTEKTINAGIQISGAVSIPWFMIVYALIAILLFEKKLSLIKSLGLALLSVLAFNHFHPQWFLWIVPFLIIFTIKNNKLYLYLALTISWIFIWLSFDPSLHAGMILWFKEALPPTMESPLVNSSLTLLSRAAIVASLIFLLQDKADD